MLALLKLFFPDWLGSVFELLLTSELPQCLHEVCLFVLVVGSMSLVLPLRRTPRSVLSLALLHNYTFANILFWSPDSLYLDRFITHLFSWVSVRSAPFVLSLFHFGFSCVLSLICAMWRVTFCCSSIDNEVNNLVSRASFFSLNAVLCCL